MLNKEIAKKGKQAPARKDSVGKVTDQKEKQPKVAEETDKEIDAQSAASQDYSNKEGEAAANEK